MGRSSYSDRRWIVSRGTALLALLAAGLMMAGCASRGITPQATALEPCVAQAEPPVDSPPDRPPEAQAGEAWCRVWIPPEVRVISETVCVKPACERTVQIPAKYGYRPQLVCVSPANVSERVVPAVWGTRTREVQVCPPRESWRRIDCPPSGDLGPCEQQCECWTKHVCPPVYRDEECPVCISPERHCVQYTPAQYKVVQQRYMISPARCETVCDPAVFETRCREECVRPGRWEWRRNTACEVPDACAPPAPAPGPEPLPALQVEMQDSAESGAEQGVFAVGSVVRYDIVISSDEGSQSMSSLRVVFTLPPEIVFVSGGGQGVTISGQGQSAASEPFDLEVGATRKLYVLCRVTSAPPTGLVQLTASVQSGDGFELATETESTTLKAGN